MTGPAIILEEALRRRFADAAPPPEGLDALTRLAARGSVRAFADRPVDRALLGTLCAVALSAPTKSDLQQRDILLVTDPDVRARLDELCGTQTWLPGAPALAVVLGNHRRQRKIHQRRGRPFANDHFDAAFNAAVDGGVVLATLVLAAETIGLGCCPVSAIRNHPEQVAEILGLPDLVFPVAALAMGWPEQAAKISPRLPLAATVHENRFEDGAEDRLAAAYDGGRNYAKQRFAAEDGTDPDYGWSEDKARQYARPERAGFGAYLRRIGFSLD